jgi:hypothetical protein
MPREDVRIVPAHEPARRLRGLRADLARERSLAEALIAEPGKEAGREGAGSG